jgi:GntR family transcriptional regulator
MNNNNKLVRNPSLKDQVLRVLTERINQGIYAPESQLPPENVLSDEFGVSRATIRFAISSLEERNLIQRRQGVGTFVSKVLSIANPLYQLIDFEDRIERQGYIPGFRQLNAEIVNLDVTMAKKLDVNTGSQGLRIHKIWMADDQPIVFIINHIPLWVFENHISLDEVLQPGFTEPFFQFFHTRCFKKVTHLSSSIWPSQFKDCNLPPEFAAHDPCESILLVEDIGFTAEGTPIFTSLEHLIGIASRFETIRRVL